MAMTSGEQARWWLLGLVLLGVFFWATSSVLLPYLAGAALAYFLDPAADRLEKLGLSRTLAVLAIMILMILVFALALLILIPAVVSQVAGLFNQIPVYIQAVRDFVQHTLPGKLDGLGVITDKLHELGLLPAAPDSVSDAAGQAAGHAQAPAQAAGSAASDAASKAASDAASGGGTSASSASGSAAGSQGGGAGAGLGQTTRDGIEDAGIAEVVREGLTKLEQAVEADPQAVAKEAAQAAGALSQDLQADAEAAAGTAASSSAGNGGGSASANSSVALKALGAAGQTLGDWSAAALRSAWTGGLALIDFLTLVVITPVVTFYLLMDWDRMMSKLDSYVPRDHLNSVRRVAHDIDRTLAGFVRGQLMVCVILGAFYAVALAVAGLQFGMVIGLFAGMISFIPFIGSIVGGALSIGVALFQFWNEPQMIAVIAAIFVVGQAVEGNVLSPKLVGGSVGLHPVALMFALSAFGALLGFTGLLIAVPAAATIGVLVRFALEQYRNGRLFRGTDDGPSSTPLSPEPAPAGPEDRQGA